MKTSGVIFDGSGRKGRLQHSKNRTTVTLDAMRRGDWPGSDDEVMSPRKALAVLDFYRRCVQYRAGALAMVPFTITEEGRDDPLYDSDSRTPPPEDLRYLLGFHELVNKYLQSLIQEAAAYAFRRFENGRVVELRYLVPTTVRPKLAKTPQGVITGLSHFERTTRPRQRVDLEDMIWLFAPSPYTELGVPTYGNRPESDGYSAMHATTTLYERARYVAGHLKNGLVGAHIAVGKDGWEPPEEGSPERGRLKRLFASLLGARSLVTSEGKIPILNKMEIQKLGEGFEHLSAMELTQEERENIAAGVKVPYGLVMSSSAKGLGGGGVMTSLEVQMIETVTKPDGRLIQGAFNKHHFGEQGLYLNFEYGRLNAVQDRQLSQVRAVTEAKRERIFTVNEGRAVLGLGPSDDLQDVQDAELEAAASTEKAAGEIRAFRRFVAKGKRPDAFSPKHAPDEIAVIKARLLQGEAIDDAFEPPFFHET